MKLLCALTLLVLLPATALAQSVGYAARVDLDAPSSEIALAPGENATAVVLLSYDVSGGLCERDVGPGAADHLDVESDENETWLSGFTHRRYTVFTGTCRDHLIEITYDVSASARAMPGELAIVRLVATPTSCGAGCAHERERAELNLTVRVLEPPGPAPAEGAAPVGPAPVAEEEPCHDAPDEAEDAAVAAVAVAPMRSAAGHGREEAPREVPGPAPLVVLALAGLLARLRRVP